MPITLTSGTVIVSTITNHVATTATDIIGLGLNGYGSQTYTTFNVNANSRITVNQIQGMFRDLNTITQHITGQFTASISVTTGTVITTSTFSDLWKLGEFVTAGRYVLHPSQRSTYTGAGGQTQDIWLQNSTSTRTTPWNTGVSTGTTATITHRSTVTWATTALARYFFNSGGDLVFKPYWTTGTGQMSTSSSTWAVIDHAWANFVGTGTGFVNEWTYNRDDYVGYVTTSYTWGSANTLSVVVTAVCLPTQQNQINFTVDYNTYVGGPVFYDDSVVVQGTVPEEVPNDSNAFDGTQSDAPLDVFVDSGGGLDAPSDGAAGGGGAKVICTELYHMGYLDHDVFELDQQFGRWLVKSDPDAYWGYRAWADILIDYMRGQGRPIIPRMMFWLSAEQQQAQSQRIALTVAKWLAEPFAYELARRVDSERPRPFRLRGYLTVSLGLPVCKLIGQIIRTRKGKKHVV